MHDGNRSVLRDNITKLKSNRNDPLTLLDYDLSTVSEVNECIGSFLSMVSSMMSRSVSISRTPYEMEREIKLFLTNIHNLDVTMNILNDTVYTPYWLLKYNFQSLLNLPNEMELFGPLINIWEDDNKGEGYLRSIKPNITDIHSKHW